MIRTKGDKRDECKTNYSNQSNLVHQPCDQCSNLHQPRAFGEPTLEYGGKLLSLRISRLSTRKTSNFENTEPNMPQFPDDVQLIERTGKVIISLDKNPQVDIAAVRAGGQEYNG